MSGCIGQPKQWTETPMALRDHRCACGEKAVIFMRDWKGCEACFDKLPPARAAEITGEKGKEA